MFLWVLAGVSSKPPGTLGAALSRNDPDRLFGSRPIPLGRQNPAATGTPAARPLSGRKRVRPWLGGGHRTVGSSAGPLARPSILPALFTPPMQKQCKRTPQPTLSLP